jgi:hypothetical protein
MAFPAMWINSSRISLWREITRPPFLQQRACCRVKGASHPSHFCGRSGGTSPYVLYVLYVLYAYIYAGRLISFSINNNLKNVQICHSILQYIHSYEVSLCSAYARGYLVGYNYFSILHCRGSENKPSVVNDKSQLQRSLSVY